jgi:hypothetical protein
VQGIGKKMHDKNKETNKKQKIGGGWGVPYEDYFSPENLVPEIEI